jgi:hypothetical protein
MLSKFTLQVREENGNRKNFPQQPIPSKLYKTKTRMDIFHYPTKLSASVQVVKR